MSLQRFPKDRIYKFHLEVLSSNKFNLEYSIDFHFPKTFNGPYTLNALTKYQDGSLQIYKLLQTQET